MCFSFNRSFDVISMKIFSRLFYSRDTPKNSYDSPSYTYFFGRSTAGKSVNDRTAMQQIAVYACVRVLSEAIAQLPLHVYEYTDKGKERVPKHPLYFLLHDQPNPEMTSFVFRETLMSHLLIYGNAYAQIGKFKNASIGKREASHQKKCTKHQKARCRARCQYHHTLFYV